MEMVTGVVAATAGVQQKQRAATKQSERTCVRRDTADDFARAVVDSPGIVAVRYSNYAVYIVTFTYYVGYGRQVVVLAIQLPDAYRTLHNS
jgi:hypothetical protein